jgi:uncharacterized membrane protein
VSAELRPTRLDAVDLLRGLVMILMALDHTRGFFSSATFYPLDLTQTHGALFWTRWITHYCAPVFVFLAGTGAFLSLGRGKSVRELSWFLLTRGLWLVLLELTVIRWTGWLFNFDVHSFGIGVIWAIGWSMVVLAALVFLPVRLVGLFGAIMILGHNLLDYVDPAKLGGWRPLWAVLHQQERVEVLPGYFLGTGYPLVPWIGVMAVGYGFGTLLRTAQGLRRQRILRIGVALTLGFIFLRLTNVYGDPKPWSEQKNFLFTVFSFIDTNKYPPSLLYLLMTLGPALIVLAILDRPSAAWMKPVLIFGRVPLFFYLLHLPLIHGLAVILAFTRHGRADWLYGSNPGLRPADYGYGLAFVYLVWIAVIAVLYPACRWFAEVKRRRSESWLSYL